MKEYEAIKKKLKKQFSATIAFSAVMQVLCSSFSLNASNFNSKIYRLWDEERCIRNSAFFKDYESIKYEFPNKIDIAVEFYNQMLYKLADIVGEDAVSNIDTLYSFSTEHALDFLERASFPKMCREDIEFEELEILRLYVLLFGKIFEGTKSEKDWKILKQELPLQYLFTSHCAYLKQELSFEYLIQENEEAIKLFEKMKKEMQERVIRKFCIFFDQIVPQYYLNLQLLEYECLCSDLSLISTCNFNSEIVFEKKLMDLINGHKHIKDMVPSLREKLMFLRILYKKEQSLKKIYQKQFERQAELRKQITDYKIVELEKVSREPTNKEKKNLSMLSKIANVLGFKSMKIIDMNTIINSYNLLPDDRDFFFSLLKNRDLQKTYKEIDLFSEENCFFDEHSFNESIIIAFDEYPDAVRLLVKAVFPNKLTYQNLIRYCFKAASEHSEERREQVIALIAWTKVIFPILHELDRWPDQIYESLHRTRILKFFCSNNEATGITYDTVVLNFLEIFSIVTDVIDENLSPFPGVHRGLFEEILFHEVCHIIFGSFVTNNSEKSRIASKGFLIKKNKKNIRENLEKINNLTTEVLTEAISKERNYVPFFLKKREEILNFLKRLQYSNEVYTNINLFNESIEMTQILGLFEKGDTLYFFPFSDFALSVKNGNPIRITHGAICSNPKGYRKNEWAHIKFPKYLKLGQGTKSILLKPNFFKILINACGSSVKDYRKQVFEKNLYANMWTVPMKSATKALMYENKISTTVNDDIRKRRKQKHFK